MAQTSSILAEVLSALGRPAWPSNNRPVPPNQADEIIILAACKMAYDIIPVPAADYQSYGLATRTSLVGSNVSWQVVFARLIPNYITYQEVYDFVVGRAEALFSAADPVVGVSILNSIKNRLGIQDDNTLFDDEIMSYINSAFAVTNQIRNDLVVPPITGQSETWESLMIDPEYVDILNQETYLRVKQLFNPPDNSFLVTSEKELLTELDWRLSIKE